MSKKRSLETGGPGGANVVPHSATFTVVQELRKEEVSVSVQRVAISEHDEHAGYIYRSRFSPEGLGLNSKLFSEDDDDVDNTACLDCILRQWIESENKAEDSTMYKSLLGRGRGIEPKQCIVKRSSISYDGSDIVVVFFLPIPEAEVELTNQKSNELYFHLNRFVNSVVPDEVLASGKHGRDMTDLREFVSSQGALAFVSNGSILPRISGEQDLPARASNQYLARNELGDTTATQGKQVVAFKAPSSLETTFTLPRTGVTLTGMLMMEGITVISGGGFQGKTTLLKALSSGYLDRISGDGREYCVSAGNAPIASLRAEDGRRVSSVDISAFISDLPAASGLDAADFSTTCASGSTSQASGVVEGLEMGVRCFLVDEDTSAVNFMIRDGRMRSLIDRETITPFIYRVSNLYKQKGISTVVVVGGSGDWFDVQNSTLLMDNYECVDATARARRISKAFCSGHIQYNGQGVVHQLSWPGPGSDAPLPALKEREESTGVKERFLDMWSLLHHIDGNHAGGNGVPIYDFSVGDDGRSIRFHTTEEKLKLGLGLTSNEVTYALDLNRVEELTATGEAHAAAVGVGMAITMLVFTLCNNQEKPIRSDEDSLLPERVGLDTELQTVSFGTLDEELTKDGGAAIRAKGYRWQRLNHILDHYERELCGDVNMLIDAGLVQDLAFSAQVWRMLGEGFIWPSRVLLGKALNRFPDAVFSISRTTAVASEQH